MSFSASRGYKSKSKSFQPKAKAQALPPLTIETALLAKRKATEAGAKCEKCPLLTFRHGPVQDEVRPGSKLIVLQEFPQQEDVEKNRHLCDRAGDIILEQLQNEDIQREQISVISSQLCKPPEDFKQHEIKVKITYEQACDRARAAGEKLPTKPPTAYDCCSERRENALRAADSRFILSMGPTALKAVADYYEVPFGPGKKVEAGTLRIISLKKQIGAPILLPQEAICVPTYHTSYSLRKGYRHWQHVTRDHITRLAKIANRGHIDWVEPEYILYPSVKVIEDTLAKMRDNSGPLTVDIETDKGTRADGEFDPWSCRLRCIGMGTRIDDKPVVICVPIRHIDGREWWEPEDKRRVVQACSDILNHNPLVGHNFSFDSQVLLRVGLMKHELRHRVYDDTILMHRSTIDCDLPHDLGFVASRYFEAPNWKTSSSEKYYENVTDKHLHLYCCKDVLLTLRLSEAVIEDLYRLGTVPQYKVDIEMAPHVRDMGTLSLCVDEIKRGENSVKVNKEIKSRLLQLQKITGDSGFNPDSSQQVRRFLYSEKRLTVKFGSKGKEVEIGKDPATGAQALSKILTSGECDKQAKDFINTILSYRQFSKLAGTYLNKLRVSYPDWKSLGFDNIGVAPAVYNEVFVDFDKRDRKLVAAAMWPEEWAATERVSKADGFTKHEASMENNSRKEIREQLIARTPEGKWKEVMILPERPALSQLHTSYKQHTVSSGRLASSPNLQNIPERGHINMREMFVAPDGHLLVGADFAAVELRIFAAVAGDKILIRAFKEGLDPHSLNAATLFARKFGMTVDECFQHILGLPRTNGSEALRKILPNASEMLCSALLVDCEDDKLSATPEMLSQRHDVSVEAAKAFQKGFKLGSKEKKRLRGYAKVFCYLIVYGGSVPTMYAFMSSARDKLTGDLLFEGLKESDVQEWFDSWAITHPETKQWQDTCVAVCKREGYTAPAYGSQRKRFFPGGTNKHAAPYNHTCQGMAAEITNEAFLKLARALPYRSLSPMSGLVAQCHDWIGLQVPENIAQFARELVEASMRGKVFGVDITSEAKISKRWSDQ